MSAKAPTQLSAPASETRQLFQPGICYNYLTGEVIGEAQAGPVYTENINATEDIIVNQGGTDSGKTVSIIKVLLTEAIKPSKAQVKNDPEGFVITVVAESVPNLKKGAMRIAESIIGSSPVLQSYIDATNKTDRTIAFTNGAIIEFTSYEDAESAKQGKRKFLFLNEAQKISWLIAWQLIKRTRIRTFIDYNPSAPFWAHTELIQKPEAEGENRNDLNKKVRLIISDHRHNPFLTKDEHDKTENIRSIDTWRVYARGLTGNLVGLIFPDWRIIPVADFPTAGKAFYGIDFGYESDPTVIMKIVRLGNNIYLHELAYQSGDIPPKTIVEILKTNGYSEEETVYCEHDPDQIRQLRRLDIMAVAARKGPGSIKAGIQKLKEYNVFYTDTSKGLKEEQKRYMWEEDKETGKPTNVPKEGWDHAFDATRYGVYSHFYRSDED